MKTFPFFVVSILIFFLMAGGPVWATEEPHPFSDHVERLWFKGKFSDVSDISELLLQDDPNDIVGLILKMEYEIEFLMLNDAVKTIDEILLRSEGITTENFSKKLPLLQDDLTVAKELIPNYPAEELEKDREKVGITSKHFSLLPMLIAAEKDGLVSISNILFNGKGQKPDDVNLFLGYLQPSDSQTDLAAGTTGYSVHLYYGETVDPATFTAELNRQDITSLFSPKPFTDEEVEIPLHHGRNTLVLSIAGTRKDGRKARDTDRLVFIVP
jgi:hypothetical protein